MNALNRVLGLVLFVVAGAAALLMLAIEAHVLGLNDIHRVIDGPFANLTADAERFRILTGAAVVVLIACAGIVAELRPPSRRERFLNLPGSGRGRTEVDLRALDELAERSAAGVEGVERVVARVDARAQTLNVRCRAVMDPSIELSAAAAEIERSVSERLTHATGLLVRDVRVRTAVDGHHKALRVR